MYTGLCERAGDGGALMSATGPSDRDGTDARPPRGQEQPAKDAGAGPDDARGAQTPGEPPSGVPSEAAPTLHDADAMPAASLPPAPDSPPNTPYSGQFPVPAAPPRADTEAGGSGARQAPPPDAGLYRSGAVPTQRDPRASGTFPVPGRGGDAGYRTSGTFPAARPDDPARSGPLPTPGPPGQWDADYRRSGPFPPPPPARQAGPYPTTRTGAFTPVVPPTDDGAARAGREGIAPVAGGSLATDRAALGFVGAALLLAVAMIAYIAWRYATFPEQIALHFGPAGPTMPDRIGEKRELWTIPFIVGLVLVANVALAWALYRYDRFAARLMTFGSALVGAIAWVVLLTLLRR